MKKLSQIIIVISLILTLKVMLPEKVWGACSCDINSRSCTDCGGNTGQWCDPAAGVNCVDDPIAAPNCTCEGGYCSDDCVSAIEGLSCQNDTDCSVLTNPHCTLCSSLDFLGQVILPWVFGIGIVLALIFLVIGGIKYTTGGDDPKKLADAKGTVTWAVIGLIVLLLAGGTVRLIWYFFGLDEDKIFVIPTTGEVIDCSDCLD